MASGKTTYWVTVAALALVMGNRLVEKVDGSRLASEVQVGSARLSERATNLLARAESLLGRGSSRFDRVQTAMAMAETRMASVETSLARQQVACARVEAVRARMMARQEFEQMPTQVAGPAARIEIVVPRVAVPHVTAPRPMAVSMADPI